MLAEEALATVNILQKLPPRNRMGNPTAEIVEILIGFLTLGYQHRPAAASPLSTRVPCGNSGFTFQKSGTYRRDSPRSGRLNLRKPLVIVQVDMKYRGIVREGKLHSRSHRVRVEEAPEALVIDVPVVW